MNAFELGKYGRIYRGKTVSQAISKVPAFYELSGSLPATTAFAAGVLAPELATVAAVGAAVYGAKQIYDVSKEIFA